MEPISLQNAPREARVALLQELGYDVDGDYVIDEEGDRLEDRYTGDPVRVDNILVLPGSTIVLDNNPVSIAHYFEEYGENF